MSKAQVSRTVKFISKAGTFTAMIQSSRGQLWQSYSGTASAPTDITPNYESLTSKPELMFVVVSSRTAVGATPLANKPTWYFGSTQINFTSGTSTGAFNGVFEEINPSTGQPYYGIRILKNLVTLADGSAVAIKAVGTITGSNYTDTVQAMTTINIYPQTGDGAQIDVIDVTEVAPNVYGRNFTFDSDNQNIEMKVESYIGSVRVDSTAQQISENVITYQWQKISNGAWTNVSGSGTHKTGTEQYLIVNEKDVMTYAKYRCRVMKNGNLIGYGKANLMDSTDPYIIEPNPSPQDETIDESVGNNVTYTPRIVSRSNPGVTPSEFANAKFNFTFTTSDGVELTAGSNLDSTYRNVSSASVTYEMCRDHGNIDVTIESYDDLNDYN